jgi:hypothetical protein
MWMEYKAMKIWVDDIRTPPRDWITDFAWCKTSWTAIILLESYRQEGVRPEFMSLDHDLGGDDTSRAIVLWMCENEFWPKKVVVHSANPVGVEWLEGMIERYKP